MKGYLDAHTVTQFEEGLNKQVDAGANHIIVDLSELHYISSAGIGALMGLTQKTRGVGGDLILVQPTEKVYSILELLGFTHIFKIVQSHEEAMESLKK